MSDYNGMFICSLREHVILVSFIYNTLCVYEKEIFVLNIYYIVIREYDFS